MKTRIFIIAFLIIIFPFISYADNKSYYLNEIVVKEKSSFQDLKKAGFSTLITREDIERSASLTLFDLLERENSLTIKSDTGSDRFSVIDLRGMGENAGSNVLVVLDDIVLNSSDLSGQSLNDIPLDMIDSVEIIRGSGSVLNGGGAVSGVVKIKTITPKKDKAFLEFNAGTDSTINKSLVLTHKDKYQSFSLNGLFYNSDGYRDNGFYDKSQADFSYKNSYLNSIELGCNASILKDEYGLPGGVSIDNLGNKDKRKKTNFPFDNGTTKKERAYLFASKNFDKFGKIKVSRSYYYKDNEYLMGYSPLQDKEEQKNIIDSVSKDLKVHYSKNFDNLSVQAGYDWFFDDYTRTSRAYFSRVNGQLDSKDVFLHGIFKKYNFEINTGIRYSKSDSKLREDELKNNVAYKGNTINKSYTNNALELGVTYKFESLPVEVFSLFSKSYRNPNIDELGFSSGDLSSQESFNYEGGFRVSYASLFKAEASFFRLVTKDEIYYGEDKNGGRFNRNYEDNTIRKGVDASLSIFPLNNVFTKISATYVSAEFKDLGYEIPLVSDKKLSVYTEYEPVDNLFLSLGYSFYSSRKQGGDIKGELKEIPSYNVYDSSITYKYKNLSFYLRVDNIFNELYATSSYENYCYPMPERSFTLGLKGEF